MAGTVKGRAPPADNGRMMRRPLTILLPAALALASMAPTARATDLKFHGLLDVVAATHGAAFDGNVLMRGDSPFDAYGLRVFGEARPDPRLEIHLQVVMRDMSGLYVDGAYAIYTPTPTRDLHVLAGKVPWAIGTWAPRTYSNKNPLIGAPLMYQYHSTLVWYEVVPDADALLATTGSGQYGINYYGYQEGRGMALVDDSYWDVGVTVTGSTRPLEYAVGMVAGTPGWGSTSQEENSGKSVLGRVGLAPLPGLRFGFSGAYGPYMVEQLNPQLPPGKQVEDYNQALSMADLELIAGHIEVRAEGARNIWETPTVGNLKVTSGYVEAKYAFGFGGFVAGRWDVMRFGKIADSSGALHPWDSDLSRLETGVGYRFSRAAQAKLVYQRTSYDVSPDPNVSPDRSLVAAQLSVGF